MLKQIQELYNESILSEAMKLYGIDKNQLKELGALESFVFEYVTDGHSYILKITHSFRRTLNDIRGEIEWLNYLYDSGINVSRAVSSQKGNLVEAISAGDSYFLVIAYEKAEGSLVTEENWNGQLYEKWGQLMGQIHSASKRYKAKDKTFKRAEWYEDDQLNVEKYLPPAESKVIEKSYNLIARLKSLPKDINSYGLIHGDFHQRNFFLKEGNITVFDFDDSQYDWFVNDIAIALYYAIWWNLKKGCNKVYFAKDFYTNFMKGYNKENKIESYWLKQIPDFLMLRHILVFVILHQIFDMNNLSEKEKELVTRIKYEIENEVPLVDIEFSN